MSKSMALPSCEGILAALQQGKEDYHMARQSKHAIQSLTSISYKVTNAIFGPHPHDLK